MKWIKFADQKPPEGIDVFVIKKNISCEFDMKTGGYDTSKTFIYQVVGVDTYYYSGWYYGGFCTHWMPIPELPEEGSK